MKGEIGMGECVAVAGDGPGRLEVANAHPRDEGLVMGSPAFEDALQKASQKLGTAARETIREIVKPNARPQMTAAVREVMQKDVREVAHMLNAMQREYRKRTSHSMSRVWETGPRLQTGRRGMV